MLRTALRYALPLSSLTLLAALFLRSRRFQPLRPAVQYTLAVVVALPLAVSGTIHLLQPKAFLPLLPPWVPGRLPLIVLTGLPELCGGGGLFFARTRRPAALCLAAWMILIFPANIYVAGERLGRLAMPEVPARTAMQAIYILLLLVTGYGLPRAGDWRKIAQAR